MLEQDPKIKELEDRLDALVRTQIDFQTEITAIRRELVRLNATRLMSAPPARDKEALYQRLERTTTPPVEQKSSTPSVVPPSEPTGSPVAPPPRPIETPRPTFSANTQPPHNPASDIPPSAHTANPQTPPPRPSVRDSAYELPKRTPYVADPVLSSATTSGSPFSDFVSRQADKARMNREEFIGKTLISLVGIVVLVLGVGIGAKYAIDNNWISPLTRIIVGYVFGFGLVGLAIKLKKDYHNFSAVLISGGMAIMYFVTYFAYSTYGLIGQLPTFGLMIMFTVFTVTAALIYSRQVIAHIGLVGAYAVPFLLSTDSGNYLALFGYMAVINTGILAVSVKKDWKPIFYTSSFFTWVIFCGWFASKYNSREHLDLALIFLAVFYAIFYATKLVQAKLRDESETTENLACSLVTTGIFYAMCSAITLSTSHEPVRYWTLFVYLAAASTLIVGTSLLFYRKAFLFFASWLFTWGIFAGWFATQYSHQEYFNFALSFLGVFFAIFYGSTLLQKRLIETEDDATVNLASSLLTGIVFYAMCLAIIVNAPLETSRYWTFFAYVAVASMVMLASSFKFFGRAFMYVVVPLVWVIYGTWFGLRYDGSAAQHFEIAAIFAGLYFALFYFSILFHRIVEDNFSVIEHTSLILANAFVFYGFGYALMDRSDSLNGYLGLYTACNAVLHLVVALAVRGLAPKAIDVVQVLTILVLTFSSIAVPVQFDGNVVTMIWAAESSILFWYGRTKGVRLFERFAYPVMVFATGSMFYDWATTYGQRISGNAGPLTPFANTDFITAIVFVVAFGFIYVTNRDRRLIPAIDTELLRPFGLAVAGIGTIVLYNMFRTEIDNYFFLSSVNAGTAKSAFVPGPVGNLQLFNIAWQINYTLFFLIGMAAVNLKKFRSTTLALVNSMLSVLALGAFATVSMLIFSELRTVFVSGAFNPDVVSHWLYIGIRPMSYVLAAGLLYLLYEYSRDPLLEERVDSGLLVHGFEGLAYTFVFVVASFELVNLMEQFGLPDATKLGLSILWGVYALVMIVIGIAKDKKHLRIAAFVLLTVTLAKLFFYDIANLETISKTILFVTLGMTLLLISFLYNKYKTFIFKTDTTQED